MRNRSQNVTGEKVRSPKGHKPAPDRQKEAGESPDKKGITVDCHRLWGPGRFPLHGRAVLSAAVRVEWEPVAGECCPPPGCFKNRGG